MLKNRTSWVGVVYRSGQTHYSQGLDAIYGLFASKTDALKWQQEYRQNHPTHMIEVLPLGTVAKNRHFRYRG